MFEQRHLADHLVKAASRPELSCSACLAVYVSGSEHHLLLALAASASISSRAAIFPREGDAQGDLR